MKTPYTPAPWTVKEHSWSRTGIYGKHIGIAALDIADEATEETQEEWQALMAANARLIAAAPEMLEELREVLAWALQEKAPLRAQEIASIRRIIDKAAP